MPPSQGNVVAQGGYTDLQRSGLDFTSLLKHEEEGEGKLEELARSRTVSSNSSPNEEADQLPVGLSIHFKILCLSPGSN